jgi:hypothetical protein
LNCLEVMGGFFFWDEAVEFDEDIVASDIFLYYLL